MGKSFKSILKAVVIVLLLAVAAGGIYHYFSPETDSLFFQKTDDEKICACLEKFETAYVRGDLQTCLECFDSKSRNGLAGAASLGSGISGIWGFNFSSSAINDLFGLAVAAQDPKLHFDIKDITFKSSDLATVTAILTSSALYGTKDVCEEVTFDMVKEDNDWYMLEDLSLF